MRLQPRYSDGDLIDGRFLVHEVKMGGMGEVYLCLDLQENSPYALKTFQLRYLTNQRVRDLFSQEVATWVALEKHANIVRCFWMDFLDDRPFMCLEWIASEERRGSDLRSWLRREPLDLRLALDFTIDICRGLIHAHRTGIVHCDLKPENILVAQGQMAKITDFGLAQIVKETAQTIQTESEKTGRLYGTPFYMAPEQWLGDAVDARTDIYAVGCILYELLTGKPPFRGSTLNALRRQHLHADIPKLTDSDESDALQMLLASCLAKQREARLATVEQLLQELLQLYQQNFASPPKPITLSEKFTAVDHTNRAVTYHQLQRYDDALNDYRRAVQLDANYVKIYYNRGLTYARLEQYHNALANFSRAIQLDEQYATAYNGRGLAYHKLQRYDEALADFAQSIWLNPTNAIVYTNRGNTYAKLNRYHEALADYSRSIQLDPTDATVYTNRGSTYANLKRHHEALADFARTIQLDPTIAQAYFNRGKAYADLQQHEAALVDYDQAIQLEPTLTQAYYNRGNIYYKLQRYNDALADYDQTIQLDPTDAEVYYNRGKTYAYLKQHLDALADYSRTIQLDPTDAKAYFNRGQIYANSKRHLDALADYSRTIQLNPNHAKAYYNRGNSYHKLQRHDNALADYKRSIQLDPTLTPAYFNIGAMLGNYGKWRDALPYFEKAAQLGSPRGAKYMAQVRQMLGMKPVP